MGDLRSNRSILEIDLRGDVQMGSLAGGAREEIDR